MRYAPSPTPWKTREGAGLLGSAVLVGALFGAPVATALVQAEPTAHQALDHRDDDGPRVVRLVAPPSAPMPETFAATEPPAPKPAPRATPAPKPTPKPVAADIAPPPAVEAPVEDAAPPVATPPSPSLRERLAAARTAHQTRGIAARQDKAREQTAKARRQAARCAAEHPQIHEGDGIVVIERSLVRHYASSVKRFNSLGWSHAYKDDATGLRGWRIGGFDCRSPLYAGGLRSKDVIRSVNGRKTNTLAQLIGVWMTQGSQEDFEIVVWRRGKDLTLRYKVI